jgi:hypothetical protein
MALATSSVESLPPSPRRVRIAAATGHVVGAHFAFSDYARNRGFETAIEDTLIRLDDVTR